MVTGCVRPYAVRVCAGRKGGVGGRSSLDGGGSKGEDGAHPGGTVLPSEITLVSSTQGRRTVVTGETLGEATPIRQSRMTSVNARGVFLPRQELGFKS